MTSACQTPLRIVHLDRAYNSQPFPYPSFRLHLRFHSSLEGNSSDSGIQGTCLSNTDTRVPNSAARAGSDSEPLPSGSGPCSTATSALNLDVVREVVVSRTRSDQMSRSKALRILEKDTQSLLDDRAVYLLAIDHSAI